MGSFSRVGSKCVGTWGASSSGPIARGLSSVSTKPTCSAPFSLLWGVSW